MRVRAQVTVVFARWRQLTGLQRLLRKELLLLRRRVRLLLRTAEGALLARAVKVGEERDDGEDGERRRLAQRVLVRRQLRALEQQARDAWVGEDSRAHAIDERRARNLGVDGAEARVGERLEAGEALHTLHHELARVVHRHARLAKQHIPRGEQPLRVGGEQKDLRVASDGGLDERRLH